MKKKIILLIILLSIFMIGAVSATATNTTNKVSTKLTDKTSNKELVKKDNTIKKDVVSKTKKDKLSITYTGTFDELESEINNTQNSKTINLQKNYKYTNDSKEGIQIIKRITINGNGHTLNGNNQSRIFTVNKGAHLILKNLNINNGKGQELGDYSGGAIYACEGKLTAINCTFTNNIAYNGGVIYADDSEVNITNCTFTNNMGYNGGAIDVEYNKITITNCTFTNNIAYHDGGAIYTNYKITIINSAFIKNIALNNGGAIDASYYELTITNCKFTNNQVGNNGGAIDADMITVTKSTFTNNQAEICGGAILAYYGKVTLNNCKFNKNNAKYGGAIYTSYSGLIFGYYTKVTVNNCEFNKNCAGNGSAIHIDAYNTTITINNARFVNNKAKNNSDSNGIYIGDYTSNMLVKKTTFKGDNIYCEGLCNLKLINTKVKVHEKSYIKITPNPIEFGSKTNLLFKSNKNYNVDIYINGKKTTYKNTTSINKTIKNLKIGKHTINIKIFTEYSGKKQYTYSNSFKIKVTKDKPKIIAKPQTYKSQIKNKKYIITLKNKEKKPIKNAKLTLKIDKKTYPAKTNNKGQATFKITNLTQKGKHTATITYKGDKNHNKATKKVKITIK